MHFTVTSTSFGEALGALALRHREAILARARTLVASNVAAWARSVERLSGLVSWVPSQGGTTAFPWLTFAEDSRPFAKALAAEGVLVVPGDCFGMPRHFRVGFGADEDFPAALDVMERVAHRTAGASKVSLAATAAG
jgi:aspartate/methionine/tyrosine aminotransferase